MSKVVGVITPSGRTGVAKEKPVVPTNTFKDKRGRTWETFTDIGYFDMICVRCLTVPKVFERDFNSPMSFHIPTAEKANQFIELIKESS
jgi:hypothetical protein